jgi:peroxiredoxin
MKTLYKEGIYSLITGAYLMIRSFFTLFFAFILVFSLPAMALAKGTVKVGDAIPTNLEFKDQNGKAQSFSKLTGDKGMVLVFIRSVEWCPFCQKQVIELNKNKKKFSDMGYSVVTVSYDQIEHMKKFVTTNNPKITLLSDPASESIRAFGILNTNSAKGTMSYGIPYPGVYLVDKDKKVQAMFFKEGYEKRATIAEISAKIEELNAPPEVPMTMENMGQDPIAPEEQFVVTPQETLPPVVEPAETTAEPAAVNEAPAPAPTPAAPAMPAEAEVKTQTSTETVVKTPETMKTEPAADEIIEIIDETDMSVDSEATVTP